MKKFYIFLFFTILIIPPTYSLDEWDDIGDLNSIWDGQKIITDDEFEKAIEQKQVQPQKKKRGQHSLLVEPLKNVKINNNYDNDMEFKNALLLIPTNLFYEGKVIPVGYYKVLAENKKDGNFFLHLYQGHSLITKIKAQLSNKDYEKRTINYVDFLDEKNGIFKIIYGSLDYNLEAQIRTLN